MRTLRRHFLYAEQETETSVGDHASKTSVLRQWLERRREFLSTHDEIPRLLTLFWTLAKPTHATHLSKSDYVAFFQCVAKALIQSVGAEHAPVVAARDWLYDSSGCSASEDIELSIEQFKEAVLQCAELILPAESDAPVFVSFFIELRDAIAAPAVAATTLRAQPELAVDAVAFKLRGLRDVVKIRGGFLQKMPPNAEHLAQIRGLVSPDMESMSLKQLLLSYNPRKFSLSRKFSSLFAPPQTQKPAAEISAESRGITEGVESAVETPQVSSIARTPLSTSSPQFPSALLSRESDDVFDMEAAMVRSIESFPALRISVVGPPGAGKTRVAQSLAKKLNLQYVSTGMAIEDAIVNKKARDEQAAEHARLREETRAAAEAEAAVNAAAESGDAEVTASEEAGGVAFDIPNGEQVKESEVEEVDAATAEAERLFNSEDLAALRRGEAISRERTLPLLIAFARKTLLKGVGVVLDDVFPLELQDAVTLDYVVSLEMTRDDALQNCAGFTLAPSSRRVYSMRERAMLIECDAVLHEQGLMDAAGFEIHTAQATVEAQFQELSARRRVKVAEAMAAAAAAALAASKPKPAEGEEQEAEAEEARDDATERAGEESAADQETSQSSTPVVLSPADRNEIVAPGEPTVPLRSLLLDSFSDRYQDFERRSSGFAASTRTQVIVVLAAQALHDILAQCVIAITGNAVGLSRSATSSAALPLTLPEEILSGGARAEQLRWLLYGDWTEFLTASTPLAFSVGPADPQQPRQLSRWRDCCLVTSTATEIVMGDPQFAVYFSGRVYLLSSADARYQFCATPLQFLRREPPTLPTARRLWVLSSGQLDESTTQDLSTIVDGSHVSASTIQREPLSLKDAAMLVTEHLQGKDAWVLTDLVPTQETVALLKQHGCLPDMIVVLTVSEDELPKVYKTPLERKKHELWSARFDAPDPLAEVLAETQPSLPVRRSALYAQAHETQAALRRVLSPLAPRVDSADDGTLREASEVEEETMRVFGPTTDSDEVPPTTEGEGNDDTEKKDAASVGYTTKQRSWLAKRVRMGETGQFCAVSWNQKRVLVPGLPDFAVSFQQKLYAFAGQQERQAFERDPMLFAPLSAQATQDLVPIMWLLGVRGSGVADLAQLLAQSTDSVKIGVVDDAAISNRVQRRLRGQLLLPLEKQAPLASIYVEELASELKKMTMSGQWDVVIVTNISVAGIDPPAQLEEDGEAPQGVAVSTLPTPELLAQCFERDLFPALVLPLNASEITVVQRGLALWQASLPPPRPRRKPVKADADAAEGEDEDAAVDPAELEAAEATRYREAFAADQEALTAALETLRARNISIEDAVNVDATQRAVTKSLSDAVTALLNRKASLFEYSERLSLSQAGRLLRSGQATVGKHGFLCPITGGDAASALSGAPTLLYRGRLYFPQSQALLERCELTPASTLTATASQRPSCRVSCCITGPPSSGKTTLARHLARRFGLAYVSPQSAVDWVLQCLGPHSTLWTKLKLAHSANASVLDAELVHTAIHTRLRAADCQRQGWVLDGYLETSREMAQCLDSPYIHPGVVFMLEGSFQRSWLLIQSGESNVERDEQHTRLLARFSAWQKHRLNLLNAWSSAFGAFHIRQIDVDSNSAWQVSALASTVLQQHLAHTRGYVRDVAMRRPARLQGLVRLQRVIETQAHAVYQAFCPVELASNRYHTSLPQHRELCVEFIDEENQATVFWLANEGNIETCCASASAFLTAEACERAQALVAKAPVDTSLLSLLSVADCEFPEMKGYCPVTFQQGSGDKDWQAILKGSVFYRASYGNTVFLCLNEQKRRLLVAEPAKYASQILPTKLPPQLTASLAFKNCPGRIEQELSGVLNETLLLLGAARPKFLGVSSRATACVYVALLLKTRAIKSLPESLRAKYTEQLRAFERDCRIGELLKSVISPSSTTSCGPAVKGVRAVRELSSSASTSMLVSDTEASGLPGSGASPGDENLSAEALRQRFDELAKSMSLKTPPGTSNQHPTPAHESSEAFLEYAMPLKR